MQFRKYWGRDIVKYLHEYDGDASGTKGSSSTIVLADNAQGLHRSIFTFTNTPIPIVSVTTGNGVGGIKIYDFPAGWIRILSCYGTLDLSVAAAKQADFPDGTIAGDIGVGTVLPANADAFGTDATDDDIATGVAVAMTTFSDTGLIMKTDTVAGSVFDGSGTEIDANINVLIDAADIDDGVTTEVLCNGNLTIVWFNGGDT